MILKSETRVLFIYTIKYGKINAGLKFYAIIRGDKGLEHLGLAASNIEDIIYELRRRGILDEVRVIVSLDSPALPYKSIGGVKPVWIRRILKILSTLEKEVVRLIGT
ncbi:MAG: hypothetical protein J7J11_01485 [Desulfurococcales archaeon]|nr:hypothetical protein [Desulfurococcales archaeon]